MRAGEARDLIRFDRKGSVSGGYVKTGADWTSLITVSAKVEAMSRGDEEVIGDKVRGVSDFKITVRDCAALASLTTSDRAINARSGVIYDLRHVDRQTGRADVIISADAGTPTEGG
jgi:hypothetical protein